MSSAQTLLERGAAAENELKKLRRRFQTGMWIFAIVVIVILAVLTWYFRFGYTEIASLKDPKFIVSLVGQLVDDQIPEARRQLEIQVDNNATTWAQQASDEAVAYIPTLRKELEKLAIQQADKVIDQLNVMGEKEFRKVLDENRDTMKKALEDLENDQEISEGVLLLLEENLAKELKMDMDALAQTPLVIVSDLNKSGKSLLKGENLSEEQQHERRVLMIVRRLQDVQFGELKIKPPTISAEITDSLEQLEHARLDKQKADAKADAKKTVAPVKKEASKAPSEEAAKPVAEKAPEAKDQNAAKPEAEKADPPKKVEAKAADDKKVAEAKPSDK